MVKVFTLNKNGKIELTQKELQKLLDDSYWEGYRANNHYWTYTSPSTPWWGVYCTAGDSNTYSCSTTGDKVTLSSNAVSGTECDYNLNNVVNSSVTIPKDTDKINLTIPSNLEILVNKK